MIFEAETSLLVAVRERLLETLGLDQDAVEIELDDQAPAMSGETFYALSPFGVSPGPHSNKGDQIVSNTFGVRVAVLLRVGNVPRDRQRNVAFLDRYRSLNSRLSEVSRVIRYNYDLLGIANQDLNVQGLITSTNEGFCKPLVPQSADAKPQMVTGAIVGAKQLNSGGNPLVVMKRGINFGGAEFYARIT